MLLPIMSETPSKGKLCRGITKSVILWKLYSFSLCWHASINSSACYLVATLICCQFGHNHIQALWVATLDIHCTHYMLDKSGYSMLPEAEPPTAGQSKFCKIMSWTQAQPQRNGNTLWFCSKKRHNGVFKTLYYSIILSQVACLAWESKYASLPWVDTRTRGQRLPISEIKYMSYWMICGKKSCQYHHVRYLG